MRIQLSVSRRADDGAVAVMVAIFAVVLIVIAAFTTDFGMAYAQRQAIATGADSAALAVIHAKYATLIADPTLTCDSLDGASGSDAASTAIALNQVRINKPFNETILDGDVTTKLECVGATNGTLKVTVTVDHRSNPILGGVLGASPINVGQKAVAALGVANKVKSLPITICTNEAKAIITAAEKSPDVAQLVPLDKVWTGGASCDPGGGSGNWGWLNFGKGVSVPDLVDYITGTYPSTLTLPIPPIGGTPGNKGNSSQVVDAMNTVMNTVVNLPVYSTVSGSGANTKYSIIGFLSVKMCGFSSNSKQATGECYDAKTPGVQLTGNDIQIRAAKFIDAASIKEDCAISSACSFNDFVTKLIG